MQLKSHRITYMSNRIRALNQEIGTIDQRKRELSIELRDINQDMQNEIGTIFRKEYQLQLGQKLPVNQKRFLEYLLKRYRKDATLVVLVQSRPFTAHFRQAYGHYDIGEGGARLFIDVRIRVETERYDNDITELDLETFHNLFVLTKEE